jgi:hypothetical protein
MKVFARALFCIFAVVVLIDPVGYRNVSAVRPLWIIQGALAVILAGMAARYLRNYYVDQIKTHPGRTIRDVDEVPDGQAYQLQRVVEKIRPTAQQARIFAFAILEPAQLRQRVAEYYTPGQRTLEQEVDVEVQIPRRLLSPEGRPPQTAESGGSDIKFPLLLLPKGALTDNLEVTLDGGESVSVLSYREYLQLAAGIMRIFLTLAYGIREGEPARFPVTTCNSADEDPIAVEHAALCEIIKRAQANIDVRNSKGVAPVSRKAQEVAELLEKLPIPDSANQVYLRFAADLVRKLSLHYALVASTPVPPGGRFILRYKRTLIPELELSPETDETGFTRRQRRHSRLTRWPLYLRGWLRVLFGTRPVSVTVSLDNAWTCQSYHVRVQAPEGFYLARQNFVASDAYRGKTPAKVKAKDAPTPVHYRFRRRLGQPYAHFYGRFFPTPLEGERRPKLQLDFFEVPPSSDFSAAIAAVACFGLVWLVGFVMSRTTDLGSDAPAFLLVFPGVAASWIGFDAPAHRLFEDTLCARLSLALTALLSVAASGLFILNVAKLSAFDQNMPLKSSVFGVSRLFWAILTALSFFNAAYLLYRWYRNVWRFKHLAERADPDGVS